MRGQEGQRERTWVAQRRPVASRAGPAPRSGGPSSASAARPGSKVKGGLGPRLDCRSSHLSLAAPGRRPGRVCIRGGDRGTPERRVPTPPPAPWEGSSHPAGESVPGGSGGDGGTPWGGGARARSGAPDGASADPCPGATHLPPGHHLPGGGVNGAGWHTRPSHQAGRLQPRVERPLGTQGHRVGPRPCGRRAQGPEASGEKVAVVLLLRERAEVSGQTPWNPRPFHEGPRSP